MEYYFAAGLSWWFSEVEIGQGANTTLVAEKKKKVGIIAPCSNM
jgi:hypothetical protein